MTTTKGKKAAATKPQLPEPALLEPPVPLPQPVVSPRWGVAAKSIVATLAIVLTALILWRFQSLISPVVLAFIIAYLLYPVIRLVQEYTRLERSTAVILVYLVFAAIVIAGAVALGFAAVEQGTRLADLLPDLITRTPDLFRSLLDRLPTQPFVIGPYTLDIRQLLQTLNWNALAREAANLIQPFLTNSGYYLRQFAQATVDTLIWSFFIFIISIYIARDLPRFGNVLADAAHQPGYRYDVERIIRSLVRIWNAYLRGQVVLALVMGALVGITLAVLGVSNSLALGVLSGFMEFLPVIGPTIGTVVAVLVAFFQSGNYWELGSLQLALIVLVAMFALQQLENTFLVPRIVGDALDLHPFVVMISVLMGTSLAGILGAILAAPVVASLQLLAGYAWRKMIDLPPFPEPEPPPKPKRGQSGLAGRWRLWRLKLNLPRR